MKKWIRSLCLILGLTMTQSGWAEDPDPVAHVSLSYKAQKRFKAASRRERKVAIGSVGMKMLNYQPLNGLDS